MVVECDKYTKSQYRHEVYRKFVDYKIKNILRAILCRPYGWGLTVSEYNPLVFQI